MLIPVHLHFTAAQIQHTHTTYTTHPTNSAHLRSQLPTATQPGADPACDPLRDSPLPPGQHLRGLEGTLEAAERWPRVAASPGGTGAGEQPSCTGRGNGFYGRSLWVFGYAGFFVGELVDSNGSDKV